MGSSSLKNDDDDGNGFLSWLGKVPHDNLNLSANVFDLLLIYGLQRERLFMCVFIFDLLPGHEIYNVGVVEAKGNKRETTVIPRLSMCHPVKTDVNLKGFGRDQLGLCSFRCGLARRHMKHEIKHELSGKFRL